MPQSKAVFDMKESELEEKLVKLLQVLDESSATISEADVHSRLNALLNVDTGVELPLQLKAEYMAFAFSENYSNKNTGWGTYFGPLAVLQNDDGSVSESPSIKLINKEIIDYWAYRAKECINPLLKARYCGLLWDFCKRVTGSSPSHIIGREYVENLLLIAKYDLHKHPTSTKEKLKRALSVAMSLNCDALVNECKDTILKYEARVAVDNKAGLWGFSFDLLLCNKNIKLSETEESAIIGDLESRLERLSTHTDDAKPDPWTSEHAAKRLATYYRARNKTDDVRRALKKMESAVFHVSEQAAPLMAHSLLKQLHTMYISFGLTTEAESVVIRIRELGPSINDDMKELPYKFEINTEEFDKYVEAITEGEMEEAIARIAVDFIPRQDKVASCLADLGKRSPFLFFAHRENFDHNGRSVADVGTLEDDPDGNIACQIAQEMNTSSVFLDAVLTRLIEKHKLDAEKLMDCIGRSPVFLEEKKIIVRSGLALYLEGNYITAVHLLIPQIEAAIRELVEIQHGAVMKPRRGGGFLLKTLDDMLHDGTLIQLLGEDMAVYLRVLLTDQRGWNLRNDVCHGILAAEAFSKQKNDRLLHTFFCLSMLRKKQDEADASP